MNPSHQTLEDILDYRFKNRTLLDIALTHRSFANEAQIPTDHNERLEYLGDVVLSLVVATALFKALPVMAEGEMTRVRSEVVSERSLAQVARRIGLGEHLKVGRGEDRTGGREKDSLLADTLEGVLGAVYVDSDFTAAERVISQLLHDEIAQSAEGKRGLDSKTSLQEFLQSQYGQLPSYELVRAEGPDHDRCYHVAVCLAEQMIGQGSGRSKKRAEQAAAYAALRQLQVK